MLSFLVQWAVGLDEYGTRFILMLGDASAKLVTVRALTAGLCCGKRITPDAPTESFA